MGKLRVGMLTSGGDCPGLNATIRGAAKAIYEASAVSKRQGVCVYETSSSPMAINGYLGLMNFSGGDAYLDIINSQSYEDALKVAASASRKDYETALSFWDSKTNNWDSKYLGIN